MKTQRAMEEHYRFWHDYTSKRVWANLGDGHTGTLLNCMHPLCVEVRRQADEERERTRRELR